MNKRRRYKAKRRRYLRRNSQAIRVANYSFWKSVPSTPEKNSLAMENLKRAMRDIYNQCTTPRP